MKAIVQERFGPPDVLQFVDTDLPPIGPDDVLVRVHAAAVNPYDWHMVRGDPHIARLIGGVGLTRPKQRVAGVDGAGQVEAVGADVRGLRPGDDVLGWFDGSFAEYARAAADKVVRKPAGLTVEQAAALPMAGQTALRAIRDVGQVRAGQQVLIDGAAGGVGSSPSRSRPRSTRRSPACAAPATSNSSTRGAAHVIDHTAADVTDGRTRYDVILDNAGSQPLTRLRQALTPTGTLVYNAGGAPGHLLGPIARILRVAVLNGVVRQHLRPLSSAWAREHLLAVAELVEAGRVTPALDRTYALADTAAALRHVEDGHARGKVVITVT